MAITPFTNIPGRGQDASAFSARADDFLGRQLPRFVTEANALADEMEQDLQSAAQAAALAQSASEAAQGMVDYKGEWSALTGPLVPPASVRHKGRLWVLTASLPNVALAEPGVDLTRWQSVNRGMIVATSNFAALSGDDILAPSASAVTITLPLGPSAGDWVAVTRTGAGAVTVARNGSTIVNVADDVSIDKAGYRYVFVYAGGTWRISMEGVVA